MAPVLEEMACAEEISRIIFMILLGLVALAPAVIPGNSLRLFPTPGSFIRPRWQLNDLYGERGRPVAFISIHGGAWTPNDGESWPCIDASNARDGYRRPSTKRREEGREEGEGVYEVRRAEKIENREKKGGGGGCAF